MHRTMIKLKGTNICIISSLPPTNVVYLSVDPNRPLIFTVHVSAAVEFRRGWKIRITQICCDQISMGEKNVLNCKINHN